MPHKRGLRSYEARQARYRKHLAVQNSRRDQRQAETVCLTTKEEILDKLRKVFGDGLNVSFEFVRGEILTSSRGDGSLQRLPSAKTRKFNGEH